MWKLVFVVCTVIVASVMSAPSLISEEEEPESPPMSAIDQIIDRFRTRFMTDLENYSILFDEIERAEFEYNRNLRNQVSKAVTEARHEIGQIFEGIPVGRDIAKCNHIADDFEQFVSITVSNITNCIANKILSSDKTSLFDVIDSTTEKLVAIQNEMKSCGGTITADTPRNDLDADEEFNLEDVVPLPVRGDVDCVEVTAKVSEIIQEAMDSFSALWKTTSDKVAALGEITIQCEMSYDYVDKSKAIVERVTKCTESALVAA